MKDSKRCPSLFCDGHLSHLDATQESAINPLVVGGRNHNLAFENLELEAVREVAPFYFGVGQVPQGEFLLIQVLKS